MSKSEQIRQRIFELMKTVDADIPEAHVHRNRVEFEADELPVITVLDGSRQVVQGSVPASRGLAAQKFVFIIPQIFAVLKRGEQPMTSAEKGEKLAVIEAAIIAKFNADAELSNLLGDQGYIEYRSTVTDFQTGSSAEGQMQMDFAFGYVYNPRKL